MSPRVLIAEDEALVALDLSSQLAELEYTVLGCAASGKEIIDLALKLSPDIILMDVRFEGKIGGLQAAAEIRKQKKSLLFL